VTGDQVNMEVEDIAGLDNLDVIDVVLVLISSAKVGVALVVLVGFRHTVLYRPGLVCTFLGSTTCLPAGDDSR
jgi:hypothetical protein